MAQYTITAPDGTSWTVTAPDDAQESEVLQFAQQEWAKAGADKPKTPRDEWMAEIRKPSSFLTRVGNGLEESVAGAAQTFANTAGGAGMAQDADAWAKRAVAESEAEGPQGEGWAGFDGGRMLGKALAAAAIPAGVAVGAGSAPGLIGAAALGLGSGLVGAAMEPVDTENEGFSAAKGAQAAIGGTAGAVLGPLASKVGQGAGVAAQFVGRKARGALLGPSPQQIDMQISVALQREGIDFASLDQRVKDYLREQARKASEAGTDLDPAQAANAATLRQAGVENPTRAQITQSPTDFGEELFLRNREGGRALADQYQGALKGLFGKLEELSGRLPPALDRPAAGRMVMDPLDEAQKRGQKLVGEIYDQANAMPGMGADIPEADLRMRAGSAIMEMQRSGLLQSLPKGLQERLREIAGTGTATVRDVRDLLETASLELEGATPAQSAAINKFRATLDGMLGDVQNPAGIEAVRGLETARGAAADRFDILDRVPLMRDLSKATTANPEPVSPDVVIPKYFTGSGRTADAKPVENTLSFLRQTVDGGPEAADQVKAQVLQELIEAGSGQGGAFLPARYTKALRSLEKGGKLKTFFTPEEIAVLQNAAKAGALLEGPAGVPRTGLLGAARQTDWADRLIGALANSQGRIAQMASVPLRAALKTLPEKAATNRARAGAPLFTTDDLLPDYLRRLGATSGALLPGVFEGAN